MPKSKHMSVLDLLALLQVAFLLLRLPICAADLCEWVGTGELLYYHSMRAVPPELVKRLPEFAVGVLLPESVLTGETLQTRILQTISKFTRHDGMLTPALNHIPLLYRWLKGLRLPIEVYTGAKALTKMLPLHFEYGPEIRGQLTRLPEVRLMALIVLTTTLLFPAEDQGQYTPHPDSLSALRLDWNEWQRSHTEIDPVLQKSYQDMYTLTERDCLQMNEDDIDQYLDWYQANIASDYISERGPAARDANFRRAMLKIFPVEQRTEDVIPLPKQQDRDHEADQFRHLQQSLLPRHSIHDDQYSSSTMTVRTEFGSRYRRYRTEEELLDAPSAIRTLYNLAAQRSGAGVALLVRTVYALSSQLEQRAPDLGRDRHI